MIITILKPFFRLLFASNLAISRWMILKTLLQLAWLKRSKAHDNTARVKLGHYIINAPDYSIISTLLKEKFVDNEYYFKSDKGNPIIIDCGANIGISLIYFKCLYSNAEVHCVEPYEPAYKYLQKNVRENNLKDVFLYRTALSNKEGEISLYMPDEHNVINASVFNDSSTQPKIFVQSVKLSTFLQQFNEVDLLKIDVEGAEVAIIEDLEHSRYLASKKIKYFAIEYHTQTNGNDVAIIETLKNAGYAVTSKILYPDNPVSDVLIHATSF